MERNGICWVIKHKSMDVKYVITEEESMKNFLFEKIGNKTIEYYIIEEFDVCK